MPTTRKFRVMDLTPIDSNRWQACNDRAGYVGQIIKTPNGYQVLGDAHDALDVHCSPKRASCPNC
jgi:hypothetical protein